MKYTKAMRDALCKGWADIITDDGVRGNGFKIAVYGLHLIFCYAFWYVVRIILALLFPLSALLIVWATKENKEHDREAETRANEDL